MAQQVLYDSSQHAAPSFFSFTYTFLSIISSIRSLHSTSYSTPSSMFVAVPRSPKNILQEDQLNNGIENHLGGV